MKPLKIKVKNYRRWLKENNKKYGISKRKTFKELVKKIKFKVNNC